VSAPQDRDLLARLDIIPRVGIVAGPLVALAVYFLLPQSGGTLAHAAVATAALASLMAVWWMTEAIPLEATALVPLVAIPLLGIYTTPLTVGDSVEVRSLETTARVVAISGSQATVAVKLPSGEQQFDVPRKDLAKESAMRRAASSYADPSIFLFLGGFLIALAIEKWGLHRRMALLTILAVGTQPARLVGGFMLATALISMWISNTATTVMMLPIGLSVIAMLEQRLGEAGGDTEKSAAKAFATSLLLGLAYSASLGGLATLVGTPPNVFFAGYMRDRGIELSFGRWMLFAVPISLVYLTFAWWLLTHWLYPIRMKEIPGGRELIRGELKKLGPVTRGEWIVLGVFLCTATMWILREPLTKLPALTSRWPVLLSLDDSVIAMAGAVALFLIPVHPWRGEFALDWKTAARVPWGVLLLFGGGLSLAAAITDSGLSTWIGQQVGVLASMPPLVQIALIVTLIVFTGELTNNLSAVVAMLPILFEIAHGLKIDPMLFCVPAVVAASCGFMLPVATPPNAIVFGGGHLRMSQMIHAGWWLDLFAIVIVPLATYTLGKWALGIEF
jgi:sodium-dependent dicarboxylate transporter 2/3/5